MKRYVLSVNSIDSMRKDFQRMEKKLPTVKKKFIKQSLDYLEERAKLYIASSIGGSSWYTITHTLENSFKTDPTIGKIINDCFYCAYVEFGTGIVGDGTHENPKTYQYDVNKHGDDGWWFKDENGTLHWTKGMKAHRFMYQATIDYVTTGYKTIFQKVFEKEIGGIFK